ncbi:collagen triple helix repeat-containing protein 1 [Strongylocentrotus purpuratus]|uniref:CTHRC1 C-terminal domain-containing protein n=1 Tax=Strongylocentrotus purpuratus TaxID=7668 RepID=A0A7M7MXX9_STRPU|nr:collagen triple helix repeat-containing protein 1 [Strongylocentrotus purpuratus]
MATTTIWYLLGILFFVLFKRSSQQCVGPEGLPGPEGDEGSQGSGTDGTWYDVMNANRNWRQCTFTSASGSDSGTIYTCSFTKNSATSSLYAAFSGTTRLHNCHGCCCRWYLTFNGAECSSPQVIDGTVYMAYYNAADLHRHRTISGVCDNIAAGSVTVALNVGACSGYGTYDCYTGWNAVSRIIVEELPASPYS